MPITAALVDFGRELRVWDGFGVTYVETAQTAAYAENPQDLGGLSVLSDDNRRTVIELIFGRDGLKPGIVKLMLDPFHQPQPEPENQADFPPLNAYDHNTTTRWSRFFARRGLQATRWWGGSLQVLVSLYGPPAWMTQQEVLRGRDLKPGYQAALARYLVSYARYLRDMDGLPVRCLSIHQQGEDLSRWSEDGLPISPVQDYSLYWAPEQVANFLCLLRPIIDASSLPDISLACGETSNWFRFSEWGYADAIIENPAALESLGTITSQGFITLGNNRWFSDWRSNGIDLLRGKKPTLPAWVTSGGWYNQDVDFANIIRNHVYGAKVNAFIPWTIMMRPSQWLRNRNLNVGTAFWIGDDGDFRVDPGYFFYKQMTRAGQPGMSVCRVSSNDSQIALMAFGSRGTLHPDAMVVLNLAEEGKEVRIQLKGSSASAFDGFRSSKDERYSRIGEITVVKQHITYNAPPRSATTFFTV